MQLRARSVWASRLAPFFLISLLAALVVFVGIHALPGPQAAIAQEDAADDKPNEPTADAAPQPDAASRSIELDEKPAVDVLKQVNEGFNVVVGWMAKVLFYRVGAHDDEFIETNHLEHYYRTRDGEGNFQPLRSDNKYSAVTPKQAKGLMAEGKLITGQPDDEGNPRPWRDGLLGLADADEDDREEVEYLTLKIDEGKKYVKVNGDKVTYRPVTKPRSQLDNNEKNWLTQAEVDRRAKQGWLKTDEKNEQASRAAWLFQEQNNQSGAPVVVLWLAAGSVIFTLYFAFVNIWGFRHAVEIVRGVYDNPKEPGEVTHFQALSSALSATVGLGNIAGVTIAMTVGGPGAFFWMLMCGVFGMTSKFVECTLGQKYRKVKEDGTILGGPMQYLQDGLAEIRIGGVSLGGLGMVLAIIFAVMCILASFGGGNMFQSNQSADALLSMIQKSDRQHLDSLNKEIKAAAAKVAEADATQEEIDALAELEADKNKLTKHMDEVSGVFKPAFGVVLATFVALVIIGGIKRIGAAASKVVPTMCLLYIAACLVIISMNITAVPEMVASIFTQAFDAKALGGGVLGVLVVGVQRAAFSNEAGVGSAAIAHSAAKTEEPVREGAVALLGPFIDTVVVCSMTALVILITGAWDKKEWVVDQGLSGAALTSQAFGAQIAFFPYVLTVAIVLFAFSTIISWSYYGERCWERLFGPGSIIVYRVLYVMAVVIGAFVSLEGVINFSDMMILSMAFPNVFGCLLLAPKVRRDLQEYWQRYKEGKFQRFK